MKQILTAISALCLMTGAGQAQDAQIGSELYDTHCAVCHGEDARGGGPLAPALILQPPNLRTLTSRHEGVFPTSRVVMRIDGRDPLVAHGSPMPVYGQFFDGEDVPMKAETGQPIMTSRPVADLVAFLEAVQE